MLYGRLPRARNPRVPHYSAIMAGRSLPVPPPTDYTKGMAPDLGIMLNDQLGDCTCAAAGHSEQVWSFNATPPMITPTDSSVLDLYKGACGYAGTAATDTGGVEQTVLTYWLQRGFFGRMLTAFVEVDATKLDDLRRTIYDCGVAYIGFDVPQYLEDKLTAPESVWDVNPTADNSIAGGHAIVLAGFDDHGNFRGISWGNFYTLTSAFVLQRVDEAYALVHPDWIAATGRTPAGLSVPDLQAQMQALQEAA